MYVCVGGGGDINSTLIGLVKCSKPTTIQFSECTRCTGLTAALCEVWKITPPVTTSTRYTDMPAVRDVGDRVRSGGREGEEWREKSGERG